MKSFCSVISRLTVLILVFALALFPVSSFAEESANKPATGTQQGASSGSTAGTGNETETGIAAEAGAGEAGTGVANLSTAAIVGLAVGGAAVVGITAAALSNNDGGGHRATTVHH